MNAVVRRAPRAASAAEPAPTLRSSADIQLEIDRLVADEQAICAELAGLEAARPDVLRSGDDLAAERHDVEILRARRAVDRAALVNPPALAALQAEHAVAAEREEAERRAKAEAEATAAVDAFMADFPGRYRALAGQLAELLAEYSRVTDIATCVDGVATPHARLGRFKDRVLISPAGTREELYPVYVDETGAETSSAYPPGSYREDPPVDPRTGEPPYKISAAGGTNSTKIYPRQTRMRTRTVQVAAKWEEGFAMPALGAAVRLPPLIPGEPSIWPRGGSAA